MSVLFAFYFIVHYILQFLVVTSDFEKSFITISMKLFRLPMNFIHIKENCELFRNFRSIYNNYENYQADL